MCTVALIDLLTFHWFSFPFTVDTNILLDIKSRCKTSCNTDTVLCTGRHYFSTYLFKYLSHLGGGGQRNKNCRTVGELYLMFRID
jgi:hypothetical protein